MVIALASVVHTPLNGYRGGDVRPYIADGDPSIKQIMINTRAKYEVRILVALCLCLKFCVAHCSGAADVGYILHIEQLYHRYY